MKKQFFLLLLLFVCLGASAQNFHEDDKEGLRRFLGKENNFDKVGLTASDTVHWTTTEDWISKINGLTWNTEPLQRLTKISWLKKELKSSLDGAWFEELTLLDIQLNSLTGLDVSQNTKLTVLACSMNQLLSLDVSNNTELTFLVCNNNQITSLDVSKNTKLDILYCYGNKLESLDVTKHPELLLLDCNNNRLTSLDISKNTKLTTLNCAYNTLRSLDVSKNPELSNLECNDNGITSLDISKNPKLWQLNCQNNGLTSLDPTNCSELTFFYFGWNRIESLDISKNTKLRILYCHNNLLTTLDASQNTVLETLYCFKNNLTSLSIPKDPQMNYLDCTFNQLLFSKLPLNKAVPLRFHDNVFEGGEAPKGSIIDLSSEYVIDNVKTIFQWYRYNDGKLMELQTVGNGQFIADGNEGDKLYCIMTNDRFPNVPIVYGNVLITKASYNLTDHLKFNVNNNHLVTAGQEIQIYAKTNVSNPDLVQFGLYNPVNGYLLDKIEVKSRRNFIYTCQIPASFYEGLYMIAPYVEADNAPTMILREKGSAYIDKMPIKIKADIWGRSLNVTDNITTTQYMQLNINNKANEMFEIEQNIPFKVYIPTTLAASASIGLFYTNGDFYMDITTARSTYTYTCNITDAVLGGDYIIMPYTKENGQVKVIERPEDKAYLIDRLPLKVIESDIWGFSDTGLRALAVPTTEADVSIYPNPVTDILYVNSQQAILSFDIYNIAGSLMKKADYSGNNAINVQSLPSGIYVLILKSAEGQLSFKFSKK